MSDASEELEALKIHRIEPEEKPRKHLSVLGAPTTSADTPVTELPGLRPQVEVAPEALVASIVAALRTVYDPEIPVNIYELGLIYDVAVDDARAVTIRMTLTAPACPVAGSLVGEVTRKAAEVPGVVSAHVDLVFDPPWSMEKMSDEAKLELGLI